MAINFYLAKKHGSKLFPTDPKAEALTLQWMLWETDRLDRQIVNYVNNTSALPAAERKPEVAAAAWAECVPAFDVLDAALAKSQYLVGSEFSLADLNVASALYRALSVDTGKWPNMTGWLNRCWERAAAKRARAMRE
jgi:glutathione S-transferase